MSGRAVACRAALAALLAAALCACGGASATPAGTTAARTTAARTTAAPTTAARTTSAGTTSAGTTSAAATADAGATPQAGAAGSVVALAHPAHVTLILDFVPNAVHAGIYRALHAGYYRDLNIDLHIVTPSSTTDTLQLIDAGRAQFGLADGLDVAQLIAAGGDAQAVMAITQRPLGGLIALASEHLTSPRQLQGRTVGITGVPSDRAVLDTAVSHAGGNLRRVKVVTIGFNGASALVAGRIAAFTGYWPDDGVALQVTGHPITVFTLDGNGGPDYPGLVMFSTRRLLRTDPQLARDFVAATVHGYRDTLADPTRSLDELIAANPDISRALAAASLRAYLPLFQTAGEPLGALRPRALLALSSWMVANRLIHRPVSPARFGTDAYLPAAPAAR